jgi:hypothetical protein
MVLAARRSVVLVSPRTRILSFGSAVIAVILGSVLPAAWHGVTGEAVSLSLMALGGIGFVSLLLLEVGLSEDRDRARARRTLRRRPPPRRRRPG